MWMFSLLSNGGVPKKDLCNFGGGCKSKSVL